MALPPQRIAAVVKSVAVVLACGLMLYLISPPLYWRFVQGAATSRFNLACSDCLCNCLAEAESMLLPGYGGSLYTDCLKRQENEDPKSVETLTEELKLQENIAEESQQRADAALLEAKKVASQYQKEAEKCSSGMETCEEARERSEAALTAQKKISAEWEKRARQLGWRDKQQSLLDRFGFSSGTSDGQSNSFLFQQRVRKL